MHGDPLDQLGIGAAGEDFAQGLGRSLRVGGDLAIEILLLIQSTNLPERKVDHDEDEKRNAQVKQYPFGAQEDAEH